MKNIIKATLAAAILLAFTVAQAEPFGIPVTPINNEVIKGSGTNSAGWVKFYVPSAKALSFQLSYACSNTVTSAAGTSNVVLVVQRSIDGNNWDPSQQFITLLAANSAGVGAVMVTNLTIDATPWFRAYLTNANGVAADAGMVTNATLKVYYK